MNYDSDPISGPGFADRCPALSHLRTMGTLAQRIALVTGSSRGIGAAIAALFAREGAKVAVHGRDRAALSDVATAIERNDGSAMQVAGTILTAKNEANIPDDVKKSLIEMHPIRRLGTPDDVARAALFLASDASAWITGQIIDVAGGAVMA